MATSRTNGDFYIFPEVQIDADFVTTKVAVKISDLSVKCSISVNILPKHLDKGDWECFWQIYNLVQENAEVIVLEND